jgi:hypothetical protein
MMKMEGSCFKALGWQDMDGKSGLFMLQLHCACFVSERQLNGHQLCYVFVLQIKKMPHKHTCASTSKVENNCMASNHWVKDRVINMLREDPTIGAAALKKHLEHKYCIKLSYYVVWDGRQMALNEILGGWEDTVLKLCSA